MGEIGKTDEGTKVLEAAVKDRSQALKKLAGSHHRTQAHMRCVSLVRRELPFKQLFL